ncbi:MAG: redoxin domain-containing protein [bacterium]
MKHIYLMAAVVFLATTVIFGACAKDTSDASETSSAGASSAATTGGASGDIDAAQSDSAPDATPSAEAYRQLRMDLAEIQKTATTRQKMAAALSQIEEKLKGFINEYPDSKEAADATLELGMVYSSMSQFDSAAKYFTDYLASDQVDEEKAGYAEFYLANAYKEMGRLDDAKKHYTIFVEKYGHLNPQYLSAAQATLADLPMLKKLATGKEPIPFAVDGLNGKKISLEEYKGKVVLLDFWATWCAPCRAEMPNVVKIYNKFNEKGFEIIGISLDNNKSALEKYLKSNKMTWPQYFDGKGWQNDVAQKYRVRQIPTTFLIDRQGVIRYRSLRGQELEQAVEKLIKET